MALPLSLPVAAAAITVEEVVVPERTAAGKPFGVEVRLHNDGPARSVHLFGALYADGPGSPECGPTSDPSFRTFTHVVQETIEVPAEGELVHPPPGERWLHRYEAQHAGAEPSDAQLCVFVAEARSGPVIQYEAYGVQTLSVRARNAPPQPSFTFEPTRPGSTEEVRFRAEAEDADGDPVAFSWDFGRFDASGRARAEGPTATHAFYPEGEYVVTLTASDGIDDVPLARTLAVGPAREASGDEDRGLPLPAVWLVLALCVGALAARRRDR